MGFCVLIMPGTIMQLLIAFVFSLLCMLLTAVASPFVSDVDDTIGKAFGFALSAVFFFAVVIKVNVLTESVEDYLPQQQKKNFEFNIVIISALMTITLALALAVTILVALQQLVHAAQTPHIKLRSRQMLPTLTVADGITWHLFLSQCACCSNCLPRLAYMTLLARWFALAASGARGKISVPQSSDSSPCSCLESQSSSTWTIWSRLTHLRSTLTARR